MKKFYLYSFPTYLLSVVLWYAMSNQNGAPFILVSLRDYHKFAIKNKDNVLISTAIWLLILWMLIKFLAHKHS